MLVKATRKRHKPLPEKSFPGVASNGTDYFIPTNESRPSGWRNFSATPRPLGHCCIINASDRLCLLELLDCHSLNVSTFCTTFPGGAMPARELLLLYYVTNRETDLLQLFRPLSAFYLFSSCNSKEVFVEERRRDNSFGKG